MLAVGFSNQCNLY